MAGLCNAEAFLQGMNYAEFKVYLELIVAGAHDQEGPFQQFIADHSGSKSN